MYIKIRNQEQFIRKAINKSGSYRKLSKEVKIPRSSLVRYAQNKAIPKKRFDSIIKFLRIRNQDELINMKLPDNFRQKIGGINCVIAKKKKGTFNDEMKKWQRFQAKKLKKWHEFMKKNKPKEYYNIQYSRFKKVGRGYKYKTKNGEKVRNTFEKKIADILYDLNVSYHYEPLVEAKNKYFFPDFLINNNIIIECTMWKGEENAYKLKNKIKYLSKNYKVYVVIPKALYNYYEILNNHLILGLDEFVPVAQTFQGKTEKGSSR